VFVETGRLTERFAADGAAMRLMLFVHVQHMNTQSISLFK